MNLSEKYNKLVKGIGLKKNNLIGRIEEHKATGQNLINKITSLNNRIADIEQDINVMCQNREYLVKSLVIKDDELIRKKIEVLDVDVTNLNHIVGKLRAERERELILSYGTQLLFDHKLMLLWEIENIQNPMSYPDFMQLVEIKKLHNNMDDFKINGKLLRPMFL